MICREIEYVRNDHTRGHAAAGVVDGLAVHRKPIERALPGYAITHLATGWALFPMCGFNLPAALALARGIVALPEWPALRDLDVFHVESPAAVAMRIAVTRAGIDLLCGGPR